MRPLFFLGVLICGCTRDQDTGELRSCESLLADGVPPTSEDEIDALLSVMRARFFPEIASVSIALATMDSADSYFVANMDLTTAGEAPLERSYLIYYNPGLLEDPAPYEAVGAILVHELKHVLDYTTMDTNALAEFAIWYATQDVSEYEHETDEFALEQGCGRGLSAYREWIYAHIPEDALAEKMAGYYTPEEIEAWMASH